MTDPRPRDLIGYERRHACRNLSDQAVFEQLYREGAEEPKMMSTGLHYRLTGRPARAAALARLMDYVTGHERIWVCRRVEVARRWMAKHPAAMVPARPPG